MLAVLAVIGLAVGTCWVVRMQAIAPRSRYQPHRDIRQWRWRLRPRVP